MPNARKKPENESTTVKRLAKAIEQAKRSAKFVVAGCLPHLDPGIEVEGLGVVKLPLKRTAGKELIARCQTAPYGKGTQTLVNKKVRNTHELDPTKFGLSDSWNASIDNAMRPIAERLGLPSEQLEAKLYKLLVYEKGGFFLPHRDSEKHDRMVASMIVVLPNPFEGGSLVVRHGTVEQKLSFDEAAAGTMPSYAAFYADCEHEVQRVASGVRLCLAYNLVLKPTRGKTAPTAKSAATPDALSESLGSWVATQPAKPLIFALDHHYTERGLSLELLKGADRQLADLVLSAAEKTDCIVHLAQVSRHLTQYADDGSFGEGDSRYDRYDRAPRRRAIKIGETYEDELIGTEWTDVHGKKQPWDEIALEAASIVSSMPLDDWKPTSEEFEGYTGNAGNTLDRWYHRSAIVVWHRDHHFDIIASAGIADSIPLFGSMAAKLTKTPKKRLEEARHDCIRFARAIIAKWPHNVIGYGSSTTPPKSPCDEFLKHVLTLHDRDTIALLLTKVAEQDESLRLSSFVGAACEEFGWSAFAQELKLLISSRPKTRRHLEIPFRDIEWLSDFCCDRTSDPARSTLARDLCALAAERFCEPRSRRPIYHGVYDRREASVSEKSLPLFLKALAASGRDEDLSGVLRFVQELPDEFPTDDCLVPCLKSLIPWSRKRFGSVPPQLASWLASVRRQLESATAQEPTPPTDWTRPADIVCNCQYCAKLKAILEDPTNEIGRIPAREDIREHLIRELQRKQSDVKHSLERKGSPHSLVLTKTNGSYDRAVKRFKANVQLLSELPLPS